jgi:CheY-like chemotaxis protein
MANSSQPAQIFIVEDNDPDVFLVEEALRSQEIPAYFRRSHDSEEAIERLSQLEAGGLPDLIIVDLNLPKINGLEILKHIRSLQQFDNIPVLILTSSQSLADRTLARKLGADAYIAKPPTLPEFLSAVGTGIHNLLRRSETEPRAPGGPSRCERRLAKIRRRAHKMPARIRRSAIQSRSL